MNFNERWSGRFCHGRLEISNRFFIIQPVARRKIQSAHPAPPVLFPRSFSCFCHYAGKGNFPAPTAADVFITKRIKLAGQRIGNKTPLSILSLSLSRPKIKYPNICRFNLNHARLQATSFNNETSYCTWQGRIARCSPLLPPFHHAIFPIFSRMLNPVCSSSSRVTRLGFEGFFAKVLQRVSDFDPVAKSMFVRCR